MKLLHSLVAGTALLGLAALASPALAIEQIHIPDASAAQNSGPPDALFDNSVPTTWQKKSEQNQSNGLGNFHFSVSGGSGYGQQTTSSFGEDANVPNSEFHQNGVPLEQPYLFPR